MRGLVCASESRLTITGLPVLSVMGPRAVLAVLLPAVTLAVGAFLPQASSEIASHFVQLSFRCSSAHAVRVFLCPQHP